MIVPENADLDLAFENLDERVFREYAQDFAG